MKYVLVFSVLGVLLPVYACILQGVAWLLLWPAISFLLVAAAYAGLGPGVFGKRASGRMEWWTVLILLPFLLILWGLWHLNRLLTREPCWNEVAPGLFLGRRAFRGELPPDVGLIVDLTAEFFEPRGIRAGREYVCFPILDDAIPQDESVFPLVERIAVWPGKVFIHCAQGHGRSALVVASVLLARGLAASVEEAIERVKTARPGVRLKKAQREFLNRLWTALRGAVS
jgi:protein-tyrosine phosphatase